MATSDKKSVFYNDEGIPEQATGEVRISNETIGEIASRAALDVKGVAALTEGIMTGISKMFHGALTEGVNVKNAETEGGDPTLEIDLSIIIEYGANIQTVAASAQTAVKEKVEAMTGIDVTRVNINVQGVRFKKDVKETKTGK